MDKLGSGFNILKKLGKTVLILGTGIAVEISEGCAFINKKVKENIFSGDKDVYVGIAEDGKVISNNSGCGYDIDSKSIVCKLEEEGEEMKGKGVVSEWISQDQCVPVTNKIESSAALGTVSSAFRCPAEEFKVKLQCPEKGKCNKSEEFRAYRNLQEALLKIKIKEQLGIKSEVFFDYDRNAYKNPAVDFKDIVTEVTFNIDHNGKGKSLPVVNGKVQDVFDGQKIVNFEGTRIEKDGNLVFTGIAYFVVKGKEIGSISEESDIMIHVPLINNHLMKKWNGKSIIFCSDVSINKEEKDPNKYNAIIFPDDGDGEKRTRTLLMDSKMIIKGREYSDFLGRKFSRLIHLVPLSRDQDRWQLTACLDGSVKMNIIFTVDENGAIALVSEEELSY